MSENAGTDDRGADDNGADDNGAESSRHARTRRRWRRILIPAGIVVAILLVIGVVTSLTPWPSAMIIRAVFQQGGTAAAAEMQPYVPATELRELDAVSYGG